jgi:SmpA / OmlA family
MIRFTNALATGVAVTGLVLGSGTVLTGCKSDDAQSAPAEKPAAAKASPAKPAGNAPASSRLSKVASNMSPEQVQEVMGSPSGQASYPTGKTFNPYNFGNDSGNRVEYKYKGQGRVVFAVPKWGGNMKVVRVDYDPTEDGN